MRTDPEDDAPPGSSPSGSLPARPADRYGDTPPDPARSRRLTVLLVVFVVAGVAWAAWASSHQAARTATWVDRGTTMPTADSAQVSFTVDLPRGRTAVCTVRAVNSGLADVGLVDVEVGPGQGEPIPMTVTVRTSEPATGGGVKSCTVR